MKNRKDREWKTTHHNAAVLGHDAENNNQGNNTVFLGDRDECRN
ncbi:MAG: hypothetical protein AAGA60_05420 [Cyanobacteria bacterium P01_E01_bin.42]